MAENNYSGIQIWVQVRGRWLEVQLWNLQPCCLPSTNLFLVTDQQITPMTRKNYMNYVYLG